MLNEDEIDIYDRQIRIWGHDVQKRIKNCSILLIGFSGLSFEIAKNLILYGIKALHIVDEKSVTHHDLETNLFLKEVDIGLNRAECSLPSLKYLNPNVTISVDTKMPENMIELDFYEKYDLTILTDISHYWALQIESCLHANNKKCIYARDFFMYGFVLYDFGHLEYTPTVKKDASGGDTKNNANANNADTHLNSVDKWIMTYPSFEALFAEHLKDNKYEKKLLELKRSDSLKRTYLIIKGILNLEKELSRPNHVVKISGNTPGKLLKSLNEKILSYTSNLATENVQNMEILINGIPDFCKYPLTEFNPICTVLAGFLCQELVKILSNAKPTGNLLLYDGSVFEADTFQLTSVAKLPSENTTNDDLEKDRVPLEDSTQFIEIN